MPINEEGQIDVDSPRVLHFENQNPTSLVSIGKKNRGIEASFEILSDKIIYSRNLSEINLLGFNFRSLSNNQWSLSEINFFQVTLGESVDFLNQPISVGAKFSKSEILGYLGDLSIGYIYSQASWLFYPKLKLEMNSKKLNILPESDLYFFTSILNFKFQIEPSKIQVDAVKIMSRFYLLSVGGKWDIQTQLLLAEASIGYFF